MKYKECPACGERFVPNATKQIYCKKCGSHGKRIMQQYAKNAIRSKKSYHTADPVLYEHKCIICDKMFKTIYNKRYVCSDRCNQMLHNYNLKCSDCGKRLSSIIPLEQIPMDEYKQKYHFCSDECKKHFQSKHIPRVCKNCGCTYDTKNKYFCSRSCLLEYNKKMKAQPVDMKQKKAETEVSYTMPEIDAATKDYVAKNGMCGICKIPYAKCERMRSYFERIPKGAVCEDDKIIFCPKFVQAKTSPFKWDMTESDWKKMIHDYKDHTNTDGINTYGGVSIGGLRAEFVNTLDEDDWQCYTNVFAYDVDTGYAETEDGVPYSLLNDSPHVPVRCKSFDAFQKLFEKKFNSYIMSNDLDELSTQKGW